MKMDYVSKNYYAEFPYVMAITSLTKHRENQLPIEN